MIATDIAQTNGKVKVPTPSVAPTVKLQQLLEELKVVYLENLYLIVTTPFPPKK